MTEHDNDHDSGRQTLPPQAFRERYEAARASSKRKSESPQDARESYIRGCLTAPVFGTAHLYPVRQLTLNDADADLLLNVVERKLAELLLESLPMETLLVELQSQLCGPEPLYAPQLRRFLHAEALAIRSRMEQVATQRKEQARKPSSPEVPTASLADCGSPTETRGRDPIDIRPFFCPAEITSNQAPQCLEILRQTTDADPENSDIYLLHYFAACTVAEIAAILEIPEEDVDNRIVLTDTYILSGLPESTCS